MSCGNNNNNNNGYGYSNDNGMLRGGVHWVYDPDATDINDYTTSYWFHYSDEQASVNVWANGGE